VQALGSGGGLGRYACIAEGPGFSRAIAGVLIELRLAGIAHEVLGDLAPDLLRLLCAYESELQRANLTDWAGMLAFATETAAEPSPGARRWVSLPMLLLDVPITSKAELAFIAALSLASPETLATVPAADEPTLALLREKLRFDIEDLDEPGSAFGAGDHRPGSLARLQRQLFSEISLDVSPRDDQVLIFSAPGESRECVEIARRVLALAHQGLAFDRIAVLLRSPQEYRAHIEEAFAGRRADPPRTRRGAARSCRTRVLCSPALRSGRALGSAVCRVSVARPGAGRDARGDTAGSDATQRTLGHARPGAQFGQICRNEQRTDGVGGYRCACDWR
jgi:hypothetical protein